MEIVNNIGARGQVVTVGSNEDAKAFIDQGGSSYKLDVPGFEHKSVYEEADKENVDPDAENGKGNSKTVEKKKRTKDPRIAELIAENNKLAAERNAAIASSHNIAIGALTTRKLSVEKELKEASRYVAHASQTNNPDAILESQELLHNLMQEKRRVEEGLVEIKASSDSRVSLEGSNKEYSEQRAEELKALSHPRELSSDHHYEWLEKRSSLDPMSYDYSPSLAKKFNNIKDEYIETLAATGDMSYVGTSHYYKDLDSLYDGFVEENYKKTKKEAVKRRELPPQSPVQRRAAPYSEKRPVMEELTPDEIRIARKMSIKDPSTVGRGMRARELSDSDKIRIYRENKFHRLSQS